MPAPIELSERFVDQCSPVISSNYDTCGTVTRATIAHLTKSQLEALFRPGGLFADLDAWFKHSIEMRACGIQRYAMYDWIMANADRTMYRNALKQSIQPGVRTASLLQPFIFGRQESVVNRDHWKITAGWAWDDGGASDYSSLNATAADYPITDAQGTAASVASEDRIVRVESRYGIPMDPNWFRQRDTLHIFNVANGVFQHGQWRVLATASDATLTFVDVLLRSENAGSSEAYDAAPEEAYMIPGINNVNDFESWCQNLPTIDPRKRVPFWIQTWRYARCIDSEYRKVYARLMETNAAWREFGDLPLAERNRQDEMEEQHRFVNAFFYNKPISSNQTLDLWESLDAINTVTGTSIPGAMGGKIIGRRANFVGVREQLRVCNRVKDLHGLPLNFFEWLDANYDIMRARMTQGRQVRDIDWWTNSTYRVQLMAAFMAYYKDIYLDQLRITVQPNQVNNLGQVYDSYTVQRPGGVRLNILSDVYFDDLLDQYDHLGTPAGGNVLLALDIGKPPGGSIYWAQTAANRKVYTTAQIDELARLDASFRCVMENLSLEQTLVSNSGSAIVECPLSSLWIEHLSLAAPVMTGKTLAYDNLY